MKYTVPIRGVLKMESLKDKVKKIVRETIVDQLDAVFMTNELDYNLKDKLPEEMDNDWIEEEIYIFVEQEINNVKKILEEW